MRVYCLFCIFVALILQGCECPDPYSRPIKRSDLYGRYVADFGETDTNFIDLYPDSVYVAYYKTDEGHLYVDSGRWDYWDHRDGFYSLVLYGYKKRHPGWCIHWGPREDPLKSDTGLFAFGLTKAKAIWVDYCYAKRQFYFKEQVDENTDSRNY